MSFLGGAECSTAVNPLSQFTKITQDEKVFQRDRLVGRPGNNTQGIRSTGQDVSGAQDNLINEFSSQKSQLLPETFSVPYNIQQDTNMQRGPLLMRMNGWAQEFATGAEIPNQIEDSLRTPQNMAFNVSEYSQSLYMNGNSSQILGSVGRQTESNFQYGQESQVSVSPGMGIGMNKMGIGRGIEYMSRTQYQPQYGFQPMNTEKGKSRMIELDDENWEEQFKQIDLEGQNHEKEVSQAVETELNQVDKVILEPERNDFGDFESIWRGIQAESSVTNDPADQSGMASQPEIFDQWDELGAMGIPLQNPKLGEYLFEEKNLFKTFQNPFDEGMQILEDGGNLSLAALAFEAAVQKDPDHVSAWVMLGSAQAQNEKETPAIRALEQALKLDPANLTALMGLAVSYTNEGYDSMAYRTLERWLSFKYPSLVDYSTTTPTNHDVGFTERFALHEKVTELFIRAAQLSPDGEHMDPDVQVGLGVLFYGAEEYDKAVDCFSAALASTESGTSNKKDQLHLLWNRLGATLANSGRSEEAITAYEKALTLRANFVRARYNLGVSCINIGCYDEAASHLLGALAMHKVVENEGRQKARDILDGSNVNGGNVTSSISEPDLEGMLSQNQSNNLYYTLRRVFSLMGRRDLANRVVADMDIEIFRSEFDF